MVDLVQDNLLLVCKIKLSRIFRINLVNRFEYSKIKSLK